MIYRFKGVKMKPTFNVFLRTGEKEILFHTDVVELIVPSPGTVLITDIHLQEFSYSDLIDLKCVFPQNLSKVVTLSA